MGRLTFEQLVLLEVIKASLALLLLGITWLLGQQVLAFWDKRKKQQELDVATSSQFQQLFGEFKEISKLWALYYRQSHEIKHRSLKIPKETREELLKRATAAESKLEAVLVKLATERHLDQGKTKYLGLFRQGYQQLRESIRDDSPPRFEYWMNHEYHFFNDLVCEVANIVSEPRPWKPWKQVRAEEARKNLREVVELRGKDWPAAVEAYSEARLKKIPQEKINLRNMVVTEAGDVKNSGQTLGPKGGAHKPPKEEYSSLRAEILQWQTVRLTALTISGTVVTGVLAFSLRQEFLDSLGLSWGIIPALLLLFLACAECLSWYAGSGNLKMGTYLARYHEEENGWHSMHNILKNLEDHRWFDKLTLDRILGFFYFIFGGVSLGLPWYLATKGSFSIEPTTLVLVPLPLILWLAFLFLLLLPYPGQTYYAERWERINGVDKGCGSRSDCR